MQKKGLILSFTSSMDQFHSMDNFSLHLLCHNSWHFSNDLGRREETTNIVGWQIFKTSHPVVTLKDTTKSPSVLTLWSLALSDQEGRKRFHHPQAHG